MHLPVEVVGEAAVIVEAAQVCAADVADLQLLVARGPRSVGQRLELALALRLGLASLPYAEELVLRSGDFRHGA
jgi:hypothetical protein